MPGLSSGSRSPLRFSPSGARLSLAAEGEASLPVPRFVSLHADKVNLRTGPGDRYPIEWVLTRKEMPVEITGQLEHWRRIRDWEGADRLGA